METLYNYIVDNYTLSSEARRIIDSLVIYINDEFTDENGDLMEVGVDFVESIIADNIGMDRSEIIQNWRG